MRNKGLRLFAAALAALLFALGGALCEEYRTLDIGASGKDVRALKERMYYLGYFTSLDFSDDYNTVTAQRVTKLQKVNGLEETGVATPELQQFIFSDACKHTGVTPKPSPVPTPSPAPPPTPVPPITNANGFLDTAAAGMDEYIYADADLGIWRYLSETLDVQITRFTDAGEKMRWYETEVRCSAESPLTSYLSEGTKPGRAYVYPEKLAQKNQVVLAISDDFFGHRIRENRTVGIIVRNGMALSNKTYKANRGSFPNLETLAVFGDGSMKTYLSDAYTAQQYLDMGATDVFAFGPFLVQDEQPREALITSDYYAYREPRCAIGMIEPYHYVILTVDGRTDNVRGAYLVWLMDKMMEKGAQEAINLDGGGTTALMFLGEQINKTGSSSRQVTSIIGFGVSDAVSAGK